MPWVYNVFTKKFDYYEAPVIFGCGDLAACGLTNLGDVTLAGVARGDIFRRGAAAWNNYALGAAGQRLEAGALDPAWMWPDSLQNVGGNILTASVAREVTMPMQSGARAYLALPPPVQFIPTAQVIRIAFDTETFDRQGEMDVSRVVGVTTGAAAFKLIDAGAAFTAADLNRWVYNTTDTTYAVVTAVDSAIQLSISANIMAAAEGYWLYHSTFTVAEDGVYLVYYSCAIDDLDNTELMVGYIYSNGVNIARQTMYSPTAAAILAIYIVAVDELFVGDVLDCRVYQSNAAIQQARGGINYSGFGVAKIA